MQKQCLNSETIADYLEGRLGPHDRESVEVHLAQCRSCLEDVLVARQVFRQRSADCMKAVPPAVTQRAIAGLDGTNSGTLWDALSARFKAIFLESSRLLHGIGYPFPDALAPVRGSKVKVSDDLVLLAQSFSGLDTEIEIEKTDSCQANVKVTIFGTDAGQLPVRVSLVKNEREVASYLVGRQAAFFDAVPFGQYALVYTRNGANLGKYDFTIKETGHGGTDV